MSLDRNNPNLLLENAKPRDVAERLTRAAHSGFLFEFLKSQGFEFDSQSWDCVIFNRREYLWNKELARYECRGTKAA